MYMVNICFYFREDIEKVKSSGDWKTVHDFYLTTFDSFPELNAVFKVIIHKACFLFTFSHKFFKKDMTALYSFLPSIHFGNCVSKYILIY